jgi:hypothetical protein
MMITAHGGALKTGRNSKKYFERVRGCPFDAIEVDVRRRGGVLYVSHMPALFIKRALTLCSVFCYASENGFKVNCDLKTKGLVGPVANLAKEMGVSDIIYFTGEAEKEAAANLDAGEIYLNLSFFKGLSFESGKLRAFKMVVDSIRNPRVKGVNVSYKLCEDAILDEAHDCGLNLSVYTVDDPGELERLSRREELKNITTNRPDLLYALLNGKA